MEKALKTWRHPKVFQERNYFSLSFPQSCEYCVHEECKSFTPTLQEGAHKDVANENGEQEDVESSKFIECIVDIPKRATN